MMCSNCRGTGLEMDLRSVCHVCKGTGNFGEVNLDEEVQAVEPEVENVPLEDSGENWDDVSSENS